MSTKDFLKGQAITIIPYCKGRKADAVGEIAEVVTEKGNGDSRYWGGNEDETSLVIKTTQGQMHVDFMGTEHEDICRYCHPILNWRITCHPSLMPGKVVLLISFRAR